jgi:hypothetical protein
MIKRTVIAFSSAIALAAVAAPAFADYSIGFDPDYVLNPYGKEVAQTHQQVSIGFEVDYVPGTYDRVAERKADQQSERHAHARQVEPGHAYADPSFGAQADA